MCEGFFKKVSREFRKSSTQHGLVLALGSLPDHSPGFPFTCSLSASQQGKVDNHNPAKERSVKLRKVREHSFYSRSMAVCRWIASIISNMIQNHRLIISTVWKSLSYNLNQPALYGHFIIFPSDSQYNFIFSATLPISSKNHSPTIISWLYHFIPWHPGKSQWSFKAHLSPPLYTTATCVLQHQVARCSFEEVLQILANSIPQEIEVRAPPRRCGWLLFWVGVSKTNNGMYMCDIVWWLWTTHIDYPLVINHGQWQNPPYMCI